MAEESKTIEKPTATAKAALLEAITTAAEKPTLAARLETFAQAYAAVANPGPVQGKIAE